MGKKKIILDVRQVVPYKHTALIVCHRTGVHYQAQVGGLLCNQVFVQGFCIDLEDLAQDFDDCAYGWCYTMWRISSRKPNTKH